MNDMINHPGHYCQGKYECLDLITAAQMNFLVGNVFKYIYRWSAKNGIQDLKKAAFYIDREIDTHSEDEGYKLTITNDLVEDVKVDFVNIGFDTTRIALLVKILRMFVVDKTKNDDKALMEIQQMLYSYINKLEEDE